MLAEELTVIDGDSALWQPARPLLDVALRLDMQAESYRWHGWDKSQVELFLSHLPAKCSLIVAVWETPQEGNAELLEHEQLKLGLVCEVIEGEIRTIRSFAALSQAGLKPIEQLEPGIEDVLEIMRVVRAEIAPVAWALFTDTSTWNDWLYASTEEGGVVDKGELLTAFARRGRCVIMGSQAAHHQHQ